MKQKFTILILCLLSFHGIAQEDSIEQLTIELNELKKENAILRVEICKVELSTLKSNIMESHVLMQYWLSIQSKSNDPNKIRVNDLIDKEIQLILDRMNKTFTIQNVSEMHIEFFFNLRMKIKDLFASYDKIREGLIDFISYEDAVNILNAEYDYEIANGLLSEIIFELDELYSSFSIKKE